MKRGASVRLLFYMHVKSKIEPVQFQDQHFQTALLVLLNFQLESKRRIFKELTRQQKKKNHCTPDTLKFQSSPPSYFFKDSAKKLHIL